MLSRSVGFFMLVSLRIENFALIDALEIEFGAGLNVLTGETGAGKSIVLDAIDVVLGGKVNGRMVRTGAQRSIVEGTFGISPRLRQWLADRDFEAIDAETIVCQREISLGSGNGVRSRLRLDGILLNKDLAAELRSYLVEIAAQGQTVQLTSPAIQRDLLDSYGGKQIVLAREKVMIAAVEETRFRQELKDRLQNEQQRLQRLDLLEYQAKELSQANLQDPDEMLALQNERDRLSHVVDLQQGSYEVYQLLYQSDADKLTATDLLGKALTQLMSLSQIDDRLSELVDRANEAIVQIEVISRDIGHYGESLEADPERLIEVEDRTRELKQICRKYGPTLADAIAYYDEISKELETLKGDGESIETLTINCQKATDELIAACTKLTELRRAAAAKLERQLVRELKPLAMAKVQFQVQILPQSPSSSGSDNITFLFSPNPGEPLQPLAATASGGEMSRFLLALKACFLQTDRAMTLIFDEIDAGVSGNVARTIASKLSHLGTCHQILCVTHQPLIAAMADRHFRVSKQFTTNERNSHNGNNKEERTIVRITPLTTDTERQQEIAQIAGGEQANEAIAFAASLLERAKADTMAKG
jgi:DNA repair protein RecN (Recombination protein N)